VTIMQVVVRLPRYSRDRHIHRGWLRGTSREGVLSGLINPSPNSQMWSLKCCRIISLSSKNCSWTQLREGHTRNSSCFKSDLAHCYLKGIRLKLKTFLLQALAHLRLMMTRHK
jgi:hypothetical protein